MYRYICQTETPEQYKRKAKKKKKKAKFTVVKKD